MPQIGKIAYLEPGSVEKYFDIYLARFFASTDAATSECVTDIETKIGETIDRALQEIDRLWRPDWFDAQSFINEVRLRCMLYLLLQSIYPRSRNRLDQTDKVLQWLAKTVSNGEDKNAWLDVGSRIRVEAACESRHMMWGPKEATMNLICDLSDLFLCEEIVQRWHAIEAIVAGIFGHSPDRHDRARDITRKYKTKRRDLWADLALLLIHRLGKQDDEKLIAELDSRGLVLFLAWRSLAWISRDAAPCPVHGSGIEG
jgi:hypothetical protein